MYIYIKCSYLFLTRKHFLSNYVFRIWGVVSLGHPFFKQLILKTNSWFLLGTSKCFLKIQDSGMLVSAVVCPHHKEEY